MAEPVDEFRGFVRRSCKRRRGREENEKKKRGQRHADLPSLEGKLSVEKQQIANRRDDEINKRATKLEADLAELEAEGAKSDQKRKVKESAEREMAQVHLRLIKRRRMDQDREADGDIKTRNRHAFAPSSVACEYIALPATGIAALRIEPVVESTI